MLIDLKPSNQEKGTNLIPPGASTGDLSSQARSRSRVTLAILIGWGAWSLYSMGLLLFVGGAPGLGAWYLVYLIVTTVCLWWSRGNLLAPIGMFTLVCFAAFGTSIPLMAAGYLPLDAVSSATLANCTVVVLVAQAAFCVGASLPFRWSPLLSVVRLNRVPRKASIGLFLLFAALQVGAGVLRIKFHLGEAGIQPTISYAGVWQFILYNGNLVLAVWFLARALTQDFFSTLLGIALLAGMSIIQALLAWRGGAIIGIILAAVVFWFQGNTQKRRRISIAWLLPLILAASSIMQVGQSIRADRLGAEAQYAKSRTEFITNTLTRSQGTSRLAAVIDYFGPLTFTNNFFFRTLLERDVSATRYIDQYVYGVGMESNSFGTSGPGGPYVAMGMLGVIFAYFFAGLLYRSAYLCIEQVGERPDRVYAVTLYAFLCTSLFNILSENLDLLALKTYLATFFLVFVFKWVLRGRDAIAPCNSNE